VTAPLYHELPVHEVALVLGTDHREGLSTAEAERRLAAYGANVLPRPAQAGPLLRFARQLHNPLIYVLLVAGAVTSALQHWVDSSVIFGVVVLNAVIGFLQESRAEAALDALRSMVSTEAHVVRAGRSAAVPSEKLVPGDLVRLEAGDKVPADCRLLRHTELQVDESALTGESLPVSKDQDAVPGATPVSDRRNMLYSGTLVTHGAGSAVVVATGASTELGEIHRLVGTAETLATPLTRKLASFARLLTVAILALAAGTFAVGLARGQDAVSMFVAAVALAVAAIPEGLPAAVTITLAIGVSRMARRRAVIRRLPAVETLGSTTVICTDKTGTLTQNQMTVTRLWTSGSDVTVSGAGYDAQGELRGADDALVELRHDKAVRWTLVVGASCNDARLQSHTGHQQVVGDPTEGALLVAAHKAGIEPRELRGALPRVATLPFTSERQLMATAHRDSSSGSSELRLLVKGASERVLDLCDSQMSPDGSTAPLDRDAVLRAASALSGQGLRVLAAAMTSIPEDELAEDDLHQHLAARTLTFVGLHAMLDPPRPAATAAVAACHGAGIRVKMITGDHVGTARAIAEQIGLFAPGQPRGVLTGAELDAVAPNQLTAAVEQTTVFARVSPEQKLRLVHALQGQDHVVAMTGDGVNDAPALRQADIGIAMGASGTEVAKEAADMVLTDDDFATIEGAVEEGRGVFDNLTKFIVWTLPTNMGQGLVILLAILVGASLPILPVQILWINMTTAVALGLMLAFEPKEDGIMTRPPRDPRRPLLTGSLVERVLLVSALLVAGAWWVFRHELGTGASMEEARTAAMNVVVASQALYLFSCRSLVMPAWRVGLLTNRWVIGGVTTQVVLQLLITYVPAMNLLFSTAPLSLETWGRVAAVGLVVAAVVETDKLVRRRRPAL
jgi:cation-transporting P-type ATPase F